MSDLDAIRERHRANDDGDTPVVCGECWQEWPCDAMQALARVAELEAALRSQHLNLSLIVASDPGPPPHADCGVCALLARPESGVN